MLKIGHRGASAYAPENTLSAFKRAIVLGADGIELDVHCCKSGELVVIHDDTVDRTTNGQGYVALMTLAELQALHIAGGEHIPTLQEVMDEIGPDLYYFIEIKHADAALLAAELIQHYIAKGWAAEKLYLISFQHEGLKAAIAALPLLLTGASFEELTDRSVTRAHEIGAHAIIPQHLNCESRHIEEAHACGLKVICWTVNEPDDIRRLRTAGVDGIIGNYPDRL